MWSLHESWNQFPLPCSLRGQRSLLPLWLSQFIPSPKQSIVELILLFELTDLLSGNKEKVKCSSGKVAYRACDKVLLYISGLLVSFNKILLLPWQVRWVEERKFWIFESVMFFTSGISYSLVFLRQKQHVRINFAPLWFELDTVPFSGSQNVPEDSEADSSRSLTCLQCLRSVILSVILSEMIFQISGEYIYLNKRVIPHQCCCTAFPPLKGV